MADIISFADRRNARLRDRLTASARKGEAVNIETRKGIVRADRLICREGSVEVVTSWGENFLIAYHDIREARPSVVQQVSTITSHGDFIAPVEAVIRTGTSEVLAFARPGRRR